MQTLFFVQLYPSETRKVLERLFSYVVYKVIIIVNLPIMVKFIYFAPEYYIFYPYDPNYKRGAG